MITIKMDFPEMDFPGQSLTKLQDLQDFWTWHTTIHLILNVSIAEHSYFLHVQAISRHFYSSSKLQEKTNSRICNRTGRETNVGIKSTTK